MNFNTRNGKFIGKVEINTNIDKPTVIYASEYFFYTRGAKVTL